MSKALLVASLSVLLVACGEKPQTASGIKSDAPSFHGTNRPYVQAGWKQGDKASWEAQLKTRTWNTQNEYVKVP